MEFTFYCQEGSPSFIFTPDTLNTRGLGGAEQGLISLTEALAKKGHRVTVYNQGLDGEQVFNGVTYKHTDLFDMGEPREIFVLYRNPMDCLPCVNADVKLFFSCDQQTAGDYDYEIFPFVDGVITISEYHKDYFLNRYDHAVAERIFPIDLGVRTEEYARGVPKIPNSLLYCSVPDRGLQFLPKLFQTIRFLVPDATLTITGGYSLWGDGYSDLNERFVKMFEGIEGVKFLGKVPRAELVKLQLQSDILAYPNVPVGDFAELFGLSVAECQVAGCIPVTSQYGAFRTTVLPEGILIVNQNGDTLHPSDSEYTNRFVMSVVELLSDRPRLMRQQKRLREKALQRFHWQNIVEQWEEAIAQVKAMPELTYVD